MRDRVQAAATVLRQHDRSLAFCFCSSEVGTVVAYLAAIEAGHAVALLDANLGEEPRASLLTRYRPELVLSPLGGRPSGQAYKAIEGADLSFLAEVRSGDRRGAALHPELALLLSTSGSTGSPKFVRLSLANLTSNAASIIAALRITKEDRAIATLPFHYSYGLSVLNTHLVAGGSIVLPSTTMLEPAFWSMMERHGCTSFAGVPYTYEMLARVGFEKRIPLALRTMTQAGGKLRTELVERYHRHMSSLQGQFFVMYGQTEATARIACLPSTMLPAKLGAAGRAVPGGVITIDMQGQPEGARSGEIVYSGPNVMMGYASSREDLALGDELQGTLRTGDLGYLDEDGILYITGRSRRIAKVFGLRVNLDEVEALLRHLGPIAAVAADDRIRIYCEFHDEDAIKTARAHLSSFLRVHHAALEFRRLASLPLNANGKIDYPRLQSE